jgi:hypothetical protein
MNSNEHAQAHAAEAARITASVHRIPATATGESLERKRTAIETAKSDALKRSIDAYRGGAR